MMGELLVAIQQKGKLPKKKSERTTPLRDSGRFRGQRPEIQRHHMAVSGAVGRNKRDGNTALSVLLGTETNQFHQFHQKTS